MLADHPTWPKKKTELIEEAVVTPPQGQGIPTPPPFPTQAQQAAQQNGAAQAQQAAPLNAKNCPFCGGVMSSMYVLPPPSTLGNMGGATLGGLAQMTVGCHNVACAMSPKMKCYPADVPMVVQLWNYRCP